MTRLEPVSSDDDLLTEGSTGDEIDDDEEGAMHLKSESHDVYVMSVRCLNVTIWLTTY